MKEVISKNLFIVNLLHLLVDFTSAGSVMTSFLYCCKLVEPSVLFFKTNG